MARPTGQQTATGSCDFAVIQQLAFNRVALHRFQHRHDALDIICANHQRAGIVGDVTTVERKLLIGLSNLI
jgi:hypothetical protein